MTPDPPESDDWLDAQLRGVSVPDGLLGRLRRIAQASDEALDAALRDVPLPGGLLPRLGRIVRRQRLLDRVRPWAVAASLLMAIGLTYLAYLGVIVAFLSPHYRSGPPAPELHAQWTGQGPPAAPAPEVDVTGLSLAKVEQPPEEIRADLPAASLPQVALRRPAAPADSPLADMDRLFRQQRFQPLLDVELNRWPAFAARPEKLPELGKVAGLTARGIALPNVPQVDVAFLLRTGCHPFVWPALNPVLSASVVPLDVDSTGYEAVRRLVRGGQRPARDQVRTEEFLAAMDYQFPRPDKEDLGLSVYGGPSAFRMSRLRLLQVGVQARDVADPPREGSHLCVLVDVSASMGSAGCLDMVRRALVRSLDALGAKDRMSLVWFNENAGMMAENVGRAGKDELAHAIGRLAAGGSTNLGAGLKTAFALAHHKSDVPGLKTRVVLVTDGLTELDAPTVLRIEDRLRASAAAGILLEAIEVGPTVETPWESTLLRLTRAGGGRIRQARNADQIAWALRELTTGRSQLVATGARLKVTFNPAAVICYRLLGHEAQQMAGLIAANPEANFCAGQSATGLYEVELRPNSEREVAVADLTWREPDSGQFHRTSQRIYRDHFAATLSQAPLQVQRATIAAETAEILRESPFVQVWPYWGSLPRVLEMSKLVDRRVQSQPAFGGLLEMVRQLIEQAESGKPHRRGGPR